MQNADDTQLFFSFHPINFDSSISQRQNALQQISSWMTANLLILNSFKTEFLLIGLKNQLAKIHNSSFDTSYFARNLGFVFDKQLTFSDQITSLSNVYSSASLYPALPRFVNCLYHCYLYVHSKLADCNFVYNKVYKSQLSRLQQIQNSLARIVVKAPN